jgi:AcrR family transcriptional regulator
MIRLSDETSDALVAAAHRLLDEHGPEALTVRRIANAAGMSTMNVYSRFGGKDGVIDELYADGYRRLLAAVDAVPTSDDVPADLLRIAATYRTWAIANPREYSIMFRQAVQGFSPSPDSVELARSGLARLVERVATGQARDDIVEADGYAATDIAVWLWATCHGMISLELDGVGAQGVDWATVYANGIRTAVNGLHPSVAPASIGT